MNKTPEQMAEEYCASPHEKDAFLAGYQAGRLNSEAVQAAKDERGNVSNEYRQRHYSNEMDILRRICAPNDCIERLEEYVSDLEETINSSNNSNGWISVKERLPEKGLHVLTYGIYTKNLIVAWRDDCDEFLGMYEWVNEHESLDQVTHWMLLPEAPKEE